MKRHGIWEDNVIVMGSDFGWSITENSGGGKFIIFFSVLVHVKIS